MLHMEQIKVEPLDLDPLDDCDKTETTLLPLPIEPEVSAGVHFLTDEEESNEKRKWDFLEYMPQTDGSVVCKRCGEVLASRTHWYRHKYKVHVNHFGNPSPLFKCEHCNVFFKSRKGFMGHHATRHADNDSVDPESFQVKEEPPEATITPIPSSSVLKRRYSDKTMDWEEQRIKEEKLVADIINRVKRECEAQGALVTRRGYSRRTTSVMNVNSQTC